MISRIPTRLVRPIVDEYLDKFEVEIEVLEDAKPRLLTHDGRHAKAAARNILAAEAKFESGEQLRSKLRSNKYLAPCEVDRLLCAMGQVERWFDWPLLPFYTIADFSQPREEVLTWFPAKALNLLAA